MIGKGLTDPGQLSVEECIECFNTLQAIKIDNARKAKSYNIFLH